MRHHSLRIAIFTLAMFTGNISCSESGFSGSSGNSGKQTHERRNHDAAQGAKNNSKDGLTKSPTEPARSSQDTGKTKSDPASDQLTQRFVGLADAVSSPVDIIFAMDTSGSMDDEKSSLEMNMSKFISAFEASAASLDYRIFMIGDDFSFPAAGDRINLVQQEVDSHDALAVLIDFFDGRIASAATVRSDAIKQIVVVTDDDAEDVTAPGFKSYIEQNPALSGKTRFNGVVGLTNSQENSQCELASVGRQYIALGSDPQIAGLIQDLCNQDWAALLQALAASIITQANSQSAFVLDHPADTTKKITVTVDATLVNADAVSYSESSQSIVFASGHEPEGNAEVLVTYYPL